MLAHELRNPLAAISNAVQLSRRAGARRSDLEWAKEVIERQVKHLARLIDDLLDVSRITRGQDPAPQGAARPRAGRQPGRRGRPAAHRGAEARADRLARTGAVRLEADPMRLEQILVNLLTNAAKYTDAGGPHRADGRGARATRSSSGSGTPASASRPRCSPRIFDLFAQGDRTIARSQGGLGIGLTLVQKLAEMHGGERRRRERGPGQGSEFTVRLPAVGRTAPTAETEPAEAGRGSPGGAPACSSSTTTWTRPTGLARLLEAARPRRPDRPTTARRPSRPPARTGPRSCCWTSACPAWTATRSPSGSGRTSAARTP